MKWVKWSEATIDARPESRYAIISHAENGTEVGDICSGVNLCSTDWRGWRRECVWICKLPDAPPKIPEKSEVELALEKYLAKFPHWTPLEKSIAKIHFESGWEAKEKGLK